MQLKKVEDESGGNSLKEQNERKSLQEKLKSKDAENTHLKGSIEDLTSGIRELQRMACEESTACREQFAAEKKALVEELEKVKSERLQQMEDTGKQQRNLLEKKSQNETALALLEKEIEHLKAINAQRGVRENELTAELKNLEKLQFEGKKEREAYWSEQLQTVKSEAETEKDKHLELQELHEELQ